jgi:hypothetical protein
MVDYRRDSVGRDNDDPAVHGRRRQPSWRTRQRRASSGFYFPDPYFQSAFQILNSEPNLPKLVSLPLTPNQDRGNTLFS